MSTTAVYNTPRQVVRSSKYGKPSRKGCIAGSLTGLGVGGSYVATMLKDTLNIQNKKAIATAASMGKDAAPFLKASKRCVALSAATIVLATTLIGTTVGAIVDAIRNKKAQTPEKQ